MIRIYVIKKALYNPHTAIDIIRSINPDFKMVYNENGKPFVKQNGMYISISHSGDWAAVGCAFNNIGVDIQKYRKRKTDFIEYVTGNSNETIPQFSKIWAIKESFVKWTGSGWIGVEPNDIKIDFKKSRVYHGRKSAYFKTNEIIRDHILCICSGSETILKERILYEY